MSSPYTGDVEVGGPADVRQLPGLTITKIAVSDMANNAYLLRDAETGEALLVDAAAEPETLLRFLDGADVRTVVTTHGHWDHHRALPEIVEATGATTVAHPAHAGHLPAPVPRPPRRRPPAPCRYRSSDRSSTATPSRWAARRSRSCTCGGTRPAASRWS